MRTTHALLLALLAVTPARAGDDTRETWLRRAASGAGRSTLHDLLEDRARARLKAAEARMRADLRALVDQNSGSRNPAGIAAVLDMLEPRLAALGFTTERVGPDREGGPHLVARLAGRGRRYLMVGHVDTIFEPDHPFQRMTLEEGDVARGPGVRDMKGGVVVMLEVLEALAGIGRLRDRAVTVILNGDEETGSLSSRPLIEAAAREADVGLVFEGSYRNRLTTSRGGLGQCKFTIRGLATHIATRPYAVDANHELAQKMVRILALDDPDRGIHVNVAPVAGGLKRNQVSDVATGEIDLRYRTPEQGEELRRAVTAILETSYVTNPRLGRATSTEFRLLLHRPPFAETPEIAALAEVFQEAGRRVGRPLSRTSSAGGSDQNLIAAQGTPCLDSLGMEGTGAHTEKELGELGSLVPAAELAAVGMLRLFAADQSWIPRGGE